jgi:hypothetical protein
LRAASWHLRSIAPCRRTRDDDEVCVFVTFVPCLVRLARLNFHARSGSQKVMLPLQLHREFPFKNIEKLTRLAMVVPPFRRLGWHSFLNDHQVGRVRKHPAIATITPKVVMGVVDPAFHIWLPF